MGSSKELVHANAAKRMEEALCGSTEESDRFSRSSLAVRSRRRFMGWVGCVRIECPPQRLMSRDFDRQVAEAQIRAAVLDRFTALGIPVTLAAG